MGGDLLSGEQPTDQLAATILQLPCLSPHTPISWPPPPADRMASSPPTRPPTAQLAIPHLPISWPTLPSTPLTHPPTDQLAAIGHLIGGGGSYSVGRGQLISRVAS